MNTTDSRLQDAASGRIGGTTPQTTDNLSLLQVAIEEGTQRLERKIGKAQYTTEQWEELHEFLRAWKEASVPALAIMPFHRLVPFLQRHMGQSPSPPTLKKYLIMNDLMRTEGTGQTSDNS